ncbi:hypothetical protein [Methylobacterium brachythecii]|uniref:Uncharacterized protein n=1 Tax=Methylobacterium brachythecii TaxID=1176177 RepID=A0A7W6AH17_9HYPH|nr:hypothetical protein [Methylobacterium brachythecii]MBB3901305.1 hypothetical protein [Methylobacterium brachythecii]GLS45682.1 hypothetical protein GCM10007884_36730 [Methylobacterium brachythecii]
MNSRQTIKTTDNAREGETSGRMRWVLVWTLILSVVAIGTAWLTIV